MSQEHVISIQLKFISAGSFKWNRGKVEGQFDKTQVVADVDGRQMQAGNLSIIVRTNDATLNLYSPSQSVIFG